MPFIGNLKRFLVLFNVLTVITIACYLYIFYQRNNGIVYVDNLTSIFSSSVTVALKKASFSTETHTNSNSLSSSLFFTTLFENNTNSSSKVLTSTHSNVEYYEQEDETTTQKTTTTTLTSPLLIQNGITLVLEFSRQNVKF